MRLFQRRGKARWLIVRKDSRRRSPAEAICAALLKYRRTSYGQLLQRRRHARPEARDALPEGLQNLPTPKFTQIHSFMWF